MIKIKRSRWINSLGIILLLVSLLYLGYIIQSLDLTDDVWTFFFSQWTVLLAASCCWTFSVYLNSQGWRFILELIHKQKVPWNTSFIVYASANIAKYLPGNFGHFLGRNLMGENLGISQANLATSSILEIIFCIFSAAIFSIFPLNANALNKLSTINISSSGWILITLILIFTFFIIGQRERVSQYIVATFFPISAIQLKKSLCSLSIYLFSFLIMGFSLFVLVINLTSANANISPFMVIGLYSLAWFVGFIVPGAPGGVGIREVALLLTMSQFYSQEQLIPLLIAHRLVTILGDLLALAISRLMRLAQSTR